MGNLHRSLKYLFCYQERAHQKFRDIFQEPGRNYGKILSPGFEQRVDGDKHIGYPDNSFKSSTFGLIQFITDLLVIRGTFSKLSMCIYGDLVEEGEARLFNSNASIAEPGMVM